MIENTLQHQLIKDHAGQVEGLQVYFDVVDTIEEKALIDQIDMMPWITELQRRVQHYGYKYDYAAHRIDHSCFLGPLPKWLANLNQAFKDQKMVDFDFDQAIVNEYVPGQGIGPHIDCEPCFSDTIVSLSLGSSCVMDFIRSSETISILLEPRSLVVLTGPARYEWQHSIAKRKNDVFEGARYARERRLSLTFRKVIISDSIV